MYVDVSGSGSCPMAGYGSGVEPSASDIRLVNGFGFQATQCLEKDQLEPKLIKLKCYRTQVTLLYYILFIFTVSFCYAFLSQRACYTPIDTELWRDRTITKMHY
jgi:hypothetical protein